MSNAAWKDYELIDFGAGRKLERFGKVICIRPETNAVLTPDSNIVEWRAQAHLEFSPEGKQKGEWKHLKQIPEHWTIAYPLRGKKLGFELSKTDFKHVGVFPEQATNWEFIADNLSLIESPECKVLNLFAYTGGASLAAAAMGAQVNHVESMKKVLNWARENADHSGISGIRWVLEDALKFLQREVKRGNKYTGIIMDPPAWGRGPKGEKWKLESHFEELLDLTSKVLLPQSFTLISTYSALNEKVVFGKSRAAGIPGIISCTPTILTDSFGKTLSLGNTLKASTLL